MASARAGELARKNKRLRASAEFGTAERLERRSDKLAGKAADAAKASTAAKAKRPGTTSPRAGQWRCEKNGHLLNKKRDACPIDGSPVVRVGENG